MSSLPVTRIDARLAKLRDEGRAALASMLTTPPDLTLLDIMLPGMDGLEILRQARRHT